MTPTAILAALLALAPYHGDRHLSVDERRLLLVPVADAIASTARDDKEAAFLIAQAWHETKFARLVLEGRCDEMPRGQRCDPDRKGRPQSVGPWQIKGRWCRGAGTLEGQAACVMRLARGGRERCRSWHGAFAAQLGAGSCTAPRAAARVETMRKSLYRVQTARWLAAQEARGS